MQPSPNTHTVPWPRAMCSACSLLSPPLHGPGSSTHCPQAAHAFSRRRQGKSSPAPHFSTGLPSGHCRSLSSSSTLPSPRKQAKTSSGNLSAQPPSSSYLLPSSSNSFCPASSFPLSKLLADGRLPTPYTISSRILSTSWLNLVILNPGHTAEAPEMFKSYCCSDGPG